MVEMSSLFSSAKKAPPHTISQAREFLIIPYTPQSETVAFIWTKNTVCAILSYDETYARTVIYVTKNSLDKPVAPHLEYGLVPLWSITTLPIGMKVPVLLEQFLADQPVNGATLKKTEVRPRAGYDWKCHSDLPTGVLMDLKQKGQSQVLTADVVVWKDERYCVEDIHPGLLTLA